MIIQWITIGLDDFNWGHQIYIKNSGSWKSIYQIAHIFVQKIIEKLRASKFSSCGNHFPRESQAK